MSTKYLTFNSAVKDAVDLEECGLVEKLPSEDLPLLYTWHVWEQVQQEDKSKDYAENTRDLAAFDTVQKFWQLWAYMPQPSELLDHKRMIRKEKNGKSHIVDALMIFKTGIRPMWEDPVNLTGGHVEYRILPQSTLPGQVDEYWNNLVLGLVGGTLDCMDAITGIRLVDKLSLNRYPCIRIEVWFRKIERSVQDALYKSLEKCMSTKLDGSMGTPIRGDVKWHNR